MLATMGFLPKELALEQQQHYCHQKEDYYQDIFYRLMRAFVYPVITYKVAESDVDIASYSACVRLTMLLITSAPVIPEILLRSIFDGMLVKEL
jgi:hypothetical protein